MSTDTAAPAAPATPAAPAAPAPATTLITAPPAVAAPAAPAAPAPGAPATPATPPAAAAPGDTGKTEGATPTPEQVEADRVAAEAATKAAGAPEQYADFTPPEGGALDPEVMTQFSDVARELNLPQDKAQLLIDKVAPVIAQRQAAQMETMRNDWATQSSADAEFGGVKLTESMAAAKHALATFGTPELTQMLNDSGIGNHPEVVRFMVRAGKAMSNDKIITGGTPASTPGIRTAAETLYPASSLKK